MKRELTAKGLQKVFSQINEKAKARAVEIEISIYGGAIMVMEYAARAMTRDVDAVIHSGGKELKRIVAEIAEENGWDAAWLNDGVKGFLSSKPKMIGLYNGSDAGQGGLIISRPTAEYLFAMKAMAMRGEADGSQDIKDIEFLIREIGLKSHDEALDLVSSFYPESRVSPKTVFGLAEIMERFAANEPDEDKGIDQGPGRA